MRDSVFKDKYKYVYSIMIPFWVLSSVYLLYNYVSDRNELYMKYPMITLEHEIRCKIKEVKQDKSEALILSFNNEMFGITALNVTNNLFVEFTEVGDSIYKEANSDVVFLIKKM